MFTNTTAYSSFSVNDLDAAKSFYSTILGLAVSDSEMGTIDVTLGNGAKIFVYPKPDHVPATFTVLNFDVDDIDKAVDELNSRGVTTKIYGDDEVPDMRTTPRASPVTRRTRWRSPGSKTRPAMFSR